MQQFTVPQFIDVESKIFGPITTRQFMIILGGAVLLGITYKLADFSLFITIAIVVFSLVVSFAFIKVNGRPFHFFILNITQTWRRPNLRVWGNEGLKTELKTLPITESKSQVAPAKLYKNSRLAELALIVDTKGKYQGET